MVREKAFPGGNRNWQARKPRGRTGRLVYGVARGQLGGSGMNRGKGAFGAFELETPIRHLRGDVALTVGNRSLDSEKALRLG